MDQIKKWLQVSRNITTTDTLSYSYRSVLPRIRQVAYHKHHIHSPDQ